MKLYGNTFCGNEISAYGQQNNRLDYATLAKAFDAVLNNNIFQNTEDIGYWEQESGFSPDNSDEIDEINDEISAKLDEMCDLKDDETPEAAEKIEALGNEIEALEERRDELEEEQDYPPEVYQWYIVSDSGAEILKDIGEIVYYNEELDMYLWGVTHYGTSWSYVLTDVPCNCGESAYKD